MTHSTVNQPSPAPTAKVAAAGAGATLATLALSLADLAELFDLPTFWDTLITGVVAVAAGYLKRERASTRL